jgi:hypothetical protein
VAASVGAPLSPSAGGATSASAVELEDAEGLQAVTRTSRDRIIPKESTDLIFIRVGLFTYLYINGQTM